MEPVLIATNSSHTDICAIISFALDMEIGYDKHEFSAEFNPVAGVGGGSLLYMDGTEYGGVVDEVTTSTDSDSAVYSGRTWTGVLASKIIMPPDGNAYRTVSGDANSILSSLITLLGLTADFAASSESSGITITNFTFARFVDAYSGITKMLSDNGAKLKMRRTSGKFVLWAEARSTITDEVDSDVMEFDMTKTHRTVNHLVCAGEGEGTDRVVVHLYADANGNVSTTQTFTGIDEIVDYYNYNNADEEELTAEGTKKLKEMQTKGAVDVSQIGKGEWDVGDILVARDNKSGETVSAPVTGKLAKVGRDTNWTLQIEYQVGETSKGGAQYSAQSESSGGGGGTSSLIPGIIYPFGGYPVPDGFLPCDGAAVSRTTYPELFQAIGTTWGAGDGSTTFNVPDLRGRVGIGASTAHALGTTGGEESHTLAQNEVPSRVVARLNTGFGSSAGYAGGANVASGTWAIGSYADSLEYASNNGKPHNNMQPYATVNYIISTGQGGGVSVDEVLTGITTFPLSVEYGGTGATSLATGPFVQKSGDTMTGGLTMTTHGGSWISQATADTPIVITPAVPTNGDRYDAFMRGTFSDGSSWTFGGILKKLYFTYYAAGRTANATDGEIRLDVANSSIEAGSVIVRPSAIAYRGTKETYEMIGFIDNPNDTYGNGIRIGGGGVTIIGGGESSYNVRDTFSSGNPEQMIVANDGNVEIWSNCQDGVGNAKKTYFRSDGMLELPGELFLPSEHRILAKIARKKSGGTGWAYEPFQFLGNNDGVFARIGAFGGADTLNYMYIGAGGYDSTLNLRIKAGGNVEVASKSLTFRAVLYDNSSGTNGNVSLSASAANYNHMRIYYRTNDSHHGVNADVYSPNGKVVVLTTGYAGSGGINVKQKQVTISGTSIASNYCWEMNDATHTSGNYIYITRVEAWNE